ncbi:hypothetical protein [Arthrobacter sp. B3I4]|uniref:hypothetical protein n=1 Tax=Arthrobacter sp. B3I4 TaxID=3042267 RepID=UPI00277D1730|nr:hypothetical protein [Arthrobacter sp. B3I4]MDQ0756083.1 hypothetical protein [Arthrobacter sp. B3I4]
MSQTPSIGRIVHFYPAQSLPDCANGPWAAIITAVHRRGSHVPDGGISASVFLPSGTAAGYPFLPFSETPKPGHWSWPPRT